jgi:hypothetical protein
MNQDDRQLIADLFERMHSVEGLEKDHEAEAFIHQSMRQNANSPYLLVQSVLAQEVALQKAEARIRELEAQVGQVASGRSSAGFGAGEPAPWEALKAASGGTSAGAWGAPVGGAAASGQAASSRRSSAVPAAGRGRNGAGAERAQPQRGGGFMAQAMTTAAGVAGGMLLARGISSLFSGSDGSASAAETASTTPTTAESATDTTANDAQASDAAADTGADQDAMQHASHDDNWGGDDWGGDDWGGDFEI